MENRISRKPRGTAKRKNGITNDIDQSLKKLTEQSQSNDIHIDSTEDLLSLKDYDRRDDVNNSRVDSMDNLISENIDFIINPSELNNSADDEVS